MGIKSGLRAALNPLFRKYGLELMDRRSLYDWQFMPPVNRTANRIPLPAGAREYLTPNNPRYKELLLRYRSFDPAVTASSLWTGGYVRSEDFLYFRGENAYVWQLNGLNMNEMGYALTTYYLKSVDHRGLFDILVEDGLFGAITFNIDSRMVSRDLLDSISEIYFLERQLNLFSRAITILDIGAGYGRLAHRMSCALADRCTYLCTDAIAESTFICEYYLNYRGLSKRTAVVPLDQIAARLREQRVDLAINIHSFSECSISAINWWISLLAQSCVKYLMVTPNCARHDCDLVLTNDGKDFGCIIEHHGYRRVTKAPKYSDPTVQMYGINPSYYHFYELS